jgi:hypothetical protein
MRDEERMQKFLAGLLLKAVAHDLVELHPLDGDRVAATSFAQRLLDFGEAAAQQADDEVVGDVGLRALRPGPVEVLDEGDDALRDGGAYLARARR